MATFEITRVDDETREWEAKKGPAAGKKFTAYTVEAKDEKGDLGRYEISRLPTSQPPALGPGEYTVEESSNPNFLPKLKKISGGNFKAPVYQQEDMSKDDYWRNKEQRDIVSQRRMGRAHAQEMSLRWFTLLQNQGALKDGSSIDELFATADLFDKDVLDADVGGGGSSVEAPSTKPPEDGDATADISTEEASPAQKRRLTNEFKKVGLVPEVMKAIVMVRCRSEKATKDGASALIQDLVDGATAESLLAEVYDAKRAGDPVGIRAAKLIPENSPVDTEGLPELNAEGKQVLGIKDESDVPF